MPTRAINIPRPTIKPDYETTCHRDGTVSYWDLFCQQWRRRSATRLQEYPAILATLSSRERAVVARHAAKHG